MKIQDISRADRKILARKIKTSIGTLDHIVGGTRNASAEMAGAIEEASIKLGWEAIPRESLCDACKKCPLAKKARGAPKPKKVKEEPLW